MELSIRNRIAITKDSRRRPLSERTVEVVNETPTGEVLLDEALKLIKLERQSVGNWIDLLSGGFRG
jgi:Golgi phosphoprotein 3